MVPNVNNIPQILHYIWIGPYADSLTYVDSWLAIQTDYTLMRWNNDTASMYINEAIMLFGGKELLVNKSITYVSDLVRLLILRDYGGIYLDHDFNLIKHFHPLIDGYDFVVTFQYDSNEHNNQFSFSNGKSLQEIIETEYSQIGYNTHSVNNCFIAVSKNNDLILQLIELTLENHFSKKEEQFAMSDWGVGPAIMTTLMNKIGIDTSKGLTVSVNDVKILDSKYIHPVHGNIRVNLGIEEFNKQIEDANNKDSTYAIHMHEHFGATGFINKTMQTFNEWIENDSKDIT